MGEVLMIIETREGFCKKEYQRLMETFRAFDLDSSGGLDVSEILATLTYLHYSVTLKSAMEIFREIDVDRSEQLNEHEFLVFMRKVREWEAGQTEAYLVRSRACADEEGLTKLLLSLDCFPDGEAVVEVAGDVGICLPMPGHS